MNVELKLCDIAKEFSFTKDAVLVNAVSISPDSIRLHLFNFQRHEYQILIHKENGNWSYFQRLPLTEKHSLSLEDAGLAVALSNLTDLLH